MQIPTIMNQDWTSKEQGIFCLIKFTHSNYIPTGHLKSNFLDDLVALLLNKQLVSTGGQLHSTIVMKYYYLEICA